MLVQPSTQTSPGISSFAPVVEDAFWNGPALPVLGGLVALVVLVVCVLVRATRPSPRVASLGDPVRAAARRHADVVAGGAVAAGVLAALAVAQATSVVDGLAEGVLVGLAPALVGAAFLAVHAVGELTWPSPRTVVRSASLQPRRAADVAPRGQRRLARALGALVLVLAAVGALTAGEDGRSVTRVTADVTSTASPYPGAFYGAWLALGAVVLVGAGEGVLRLVAQRPAVAQVGGAWDLALRRLSAHRVLRGVQVPLALTAAGMLFYGANAAARAGYPGAAVLVVVAVALALAGIALAVRPAPDPDAAVAPAPDGGARAHA